MKKSPKKTKTTKHLLLHDLLVSLSYNGTITRSLLAAFLIGSFMLLSVYVVSISTLSAAYPFGWTVRDAFIAFAALSIFFLLYDAAYVTIALRYRLSYWIDVILCFGVELGFLAVVFIPLYTANTMIDPSPATKILLLVAPLFVLCIRILLGMRTPQPRKK